VGRQQRGQRSTNKDGDKSKGGERTGRAKGRRSRRVGMGRSAQSAMGQRGCTAAQSRRDAQKHGEQQSRFTGVRVAGT
jgi:hypothetical protein